MRSPPSATQALRTPAPLPDPCLASAIPPDVPRSLLERPFLRHERRADYEALLESVCRGLEVRDILEFLCAQSITDAVWEGLRLRRVRDEHLGYLGRQAALDLIREGLEPHYSDYQE